MLLYTIIHKIYETDSNISPIDKYYVFIINYFSYYSYN